MDDCSSIYYPDTTWLFTFSLNLVELKSYPKYRTWTVHIYLPCNSQELLLVLEHSDAHKALTTSLPAIHWKVFYYLKGNSLTAAYYPVSNTVAVICNNQGNSVLAVYYRLHNSLLLMYYPQGKSVPVIYYHGTIGHLTSIKIHCCISMPLKKYYFVHHLHMICEYDSTALVSTREQVYFQLHGKAINNSYQTTLGWQ